MQLFIVDAKKQHIKEQLSKVAHNPTRPKVFSPASIWLCGTETV